MSHLVPLCICQPRLVDVPTFRNKGDGTGLPICDCEMILRVPRACDQIVDFIQLDRVDNIRF